MTAASRFIDCAGFELHLMDWGAANAPPVVMWHGLARNGRDFDAVARALSDNYRCVCPDTIGRGLSQWAKDPAADYGYDRYGEIAAALADGLGFNTLRWVGTSMGGLIGVTAAAGALKGRISHLVINDVGPAVPAEGRERIASYVGNPPAFDRLSELEGWLRTVYAPFGDNPDAFWRTMAETSCRRLPDGRVTAHYDPDIVLQLTGQERDFDLWPQYEAIECPILLLRGATSDVLPRETADEMVARNANCRLVEIEGFGHAPTLVADDQVALIREFLAS